MYGSSRRLRVELSLFLLFTFALCLNGILPQQQSACSNNFVLRERGGRARPHRLSARTPQTSRPLPKSSSALKSSFQNKLNLINFRSTKLKEYKEKWGQSEDIAKPDMVERNMNFSRAKEHEKASDVSADRLLNPDQILKRLNNSGLCLYEELDSKVKTYIIQLKKAGKRITLMNALKEFEEFLQKPKSFKHRVRNKSAVLTKLLLKCIKDKKLARAKNPEEEAEDDPYALRKEEWSEDLSFWTSINPKSKGVVTAEQDSILQQQYPTVLSKRTLRFDQPLEVVLTIEKLRSLLFLGVVSSRCYKDQTPLSCWWGNLNMTGQVTYLVTNGRILDGGNMLLMTGANFSEGDEVVFRFVPGNSSVCILKDGQVLASFRSKFARGRIGVQFKNAGDVVRVAGSRKLPRTDDNVTTEVGQNELNVTVNISMEAKKENATTVPSLKSPFGGRKVFVGGTRDLDSEELRDHFWRFGEVASAGVIRDKEKRKRGFGYVTFYHLRDAKKALKKAKTTYKTKTSFALMDIRPCEVETKLTQKLDQKTAKILEAAEKDKLLKKTMEDFKKLDLDEIKEKEKTARATRAVALDCEMVGIGERGRDSCLARVTIVNEFLEVIYLRNVIPTQKVTDLRSHITGLSLDDLTEEAGAVPMETVQEEVSALLKDKVLVGHALRNDLRALMLIHPVRSTRDTAKFKFLRPPGAGGMPRLKDLAATHLNQKIQEGVHDPIEDARAAMEIYLKFKEMWERSYDVYSNKVMTCSALCLSPPCSILVLVN
eukprot:754083-Hanusia_phi.AAC.3